MVPKANEIEWYEAATPQLVEGFPPVSTGWDFVLKRSAKKNPKVRLSSVPFSMKEAVQRVARIGSAGVAFDL
jgi:hypothetical protein